MYYHTVEKKEKESNVLHVPRRTLEGIKIVMPMLIKAVVSAVYFVKQTVMEHHRQFCKKKNKKLEHYYFYL